MRIAITGATGFIGRHLAAALAARGDTVIALGRDGAALATLAYPGVEPVETAYGEAELERSLAGVDAIVHLAGRRTSRDDEPLRFDHFVEANIEVLERLLFAARSAGVTRFVLASTTAVYSQANTSPYVENEPARPLNPYGLSKLVCEQMLDMWARQTSMAAFSLRIAASYGPGERVSAVLMKFVDNAIAGRPLVVRGNRQASIEMIYVRDVISAIVACLCSNITGGTFNIGIGQVTSIIGVAEAVNEVFGNKENIDISDSFEGDARHAFLNVDKASRYLKWSPSFSLHEGLMDFRRSLGGGSRLDERTTL